MIIRLDSIRRRVNDDDLYDVLLEVDGKRQSIRCRVVEHTGIRVVQAAPDILGTLPFPPRLLVSAVLAFDEARKEADTSSAFRPSSSRT